MDLNQHMALLLSSHGSLGRNLMNCGQLGRSYDFKFMTCDLESLRKSIGGTRNKSKLLELFFSKKPMSKQPWTNIGVLQIFRTSVLLLRQIELLIREPQPTMGQ
ncbi:hypothetical protein CR513_33150, partial [Mucuna pruriens]